MNSQKNEPFQLQSDKLKVSGDGVFYTLQGEGLSMGLPAVFLRLHLCNLHCPWCDAAYTWNPKLDEFWSEQRDWGISEAVQRIEAAWLCGNKKIRPRLVITGGEPLIQQDKLLQLVQHLPQWVIEVETNGSIRPHPELVMRCQWNCSPKLAHSQNVRESRIKAEAIAAFQLADTFFKFVVRDEADVEEMERDYVKAFDMDPNRVILMPEGVDSYEIHARGKELAEIAKQRGYRLLLRMQIDLWGNVRRK